MITDASRLFRSSEHAILGGVCAGLARRLAWPTSLVRVAALVLASASGVGVVLYLLAWMIVPRIDPAFEPEPVREPVHRVSRSAMLGGVCAGVAEALRADVSLVRLAFAVAAVFGGVGVMAYLCAWVLLPADDGLGAWVG